MSRLRNKIRENYSQIPNDLILDKLINFQARFLFVWMASKPDDWDFYMGNICKELGMHEDTVRKYLKELVEWGWMEKGNQSIKNGQFGAVEYILNEVREEELYRDRKKQSLTEPGT